MNNLLFDSHAHLLDERFSQDIKDIIRPVSGIVCVFQPDEDKNKFQDLLKESHIWGACSIHPHFAEKASEMWSGLMEVLEFEKIVGFGEIGLDYYYDFSPRKVQEDIFITQLREARKKDLPVIIHSREAFKQTMDVLDRERPGKVLFHCFSGDKDQMKEVISRGWYIGVGGIITFPNADKLRNVVKNVPMNRLLVETDAPYLAPQKHRGKRNKPEYVRYVVEKIADLKSIPYEGAADTTFKNAVDFFGLKNG